MGHVYKCCNKIHRVWCTHLQEHVGCLDRVLSSLYQPVQVHTANGLSLDFFAFGLSLALTVLLILGTHETSLFNLGMSSPSSALKGDLLKQVSACMNTLAATSCLG